MEKIPVRISPRKKENVPIKHAITNEIAIPLFNDCLALIGCPAPIFCATNALKLCAIADGINIIKPQTFSATPTPAEATSPNEFTAV